MEERKSIAQKITSLFWYLIVIKRSYMKTIETLLQTHIQYGVMMDIRFNGARTTNIYILSTVYTI